VVERLQRNRVVREALVFLAFCAFTALLTWPYVLHLRDAVADPGDPYLVSWILWWDYHQTFTDPLNLFHSNLFYPMRYTLAFSEHCYGIALPFFPLYAFGVRPLTVHVVAMFFGFATSGYGAFRLARTLTGSTGAGWIAGIAFAFVPFRFGLMSHLPYLFSMWIPLVFEALVLFARDRTKARAAWLGVAFFMLGLTTISWFTFSLVSLALVAAILLTRYAIWRDAAFWRRGTMALGLASIALLPFMLPYYQAARLYNFQRSIDEVKAESAWPIHWLCAEPRNRLWRGLGANLTDGGRFKLFPGLLPILLSLYAWFSRGVSRGSAATETEERSRWIPWLDGLAVVALIVAVPVIGTVAKGKLNTLSTFVASEHVLALLGIAIIVRFALAYPRALQFQNANLIETLRSDRRSDAFWIGVILTFIGFFYSLGWNFFFYRILYDLIPMFRSMRVAVRGAMIAYLGLAILAGLGGIKLAEALRARRPRFQSSVVVAMICALLLFELNAARLRFVHGDVEPDAVSLRLRDTRMRGGLVVLPANASVNHHHLLRAADHMKPMVIGTSGFDSPYEVQIELATRAGPIPANFMKYLEEIPASYLVITNHLIPPERRVDYETFLGRAVAAGRLRYVNRFDDRDDLYAVVKNEPDAKSEAPPPFQLTTKDWATLLKEDPVNLLGDDRAWAQTLYLMHVASFGTMPRYAEFLPDSIHLGRGIVASSLDDQQTTLDENLRRLAEDWVRRPNFKAQYDGLNDERFVDTLAANAGITLSPAERTELLDAAAKSRASALVAVARHPDFVRREQNRSMILLHYFGYLRRNPEDPPDGNLNGFNFWLKEIERTGDIEKLPRAFMASFEYEVRKKKSRP
jgi:hypothetical protein